MSFSRLVIKILQVLIILYVSYDIFKEPQKNIKVLEERYKILHSYVLQQTKPYFELPPKMDPLKNQIPYENIAHGVGFVLGFVGILTLLFNSSIIAIILSIICLQFPIFIHFPYMHEQAIRHIEAKEGLLDIGIAGGFLILASYYANKKHQANTQNKKESTSGQAQNKKKKQ
ncbi:hypothetical protein pb186bvf_015873 [Paramecium bursaria]